MGTRMSYDEFERRYLDHAGSLTGDDADPKAANELCRAVYDVMAREDVYNRPEVYLRLAEVHYSNPPQRDTSDTQVLVEGIYGSSVLCINGNWVCFEKALELVRPVLCELPLHDRIVGALRCLGWGNPAIAALYREVLSAIASDLQESTNLSQSPALLARLREGFCSRLVSLDRNHQWLSQVISHESDMDLEFDALRVFRKMSAKDETARFARRHNERDRWALLRDRWPRIKKHCRERLKCSCFLEKRMDKARYVEQSYR